MKKIKKIVLCAGLALFVILMSCGRPSHILNSDIVGTININLDELKKRETLLFSQLFETVNAVVLSDSVLIGDFTKILVHDDKIFILDRRLICVHVFDRKGNYLRQIGSRGEGPGEMLSVSDMSIDRINNYIYILDRHSQRVNKYNIADGRFLSSVVFPRDIVRGSHFVYYNNKIFLAQSGVAATVCYLFRVLSLNDGNIDFIVPTSYNQGWDGATNTNNNDGPFLFKSDGTPLFSHKFMYVVYEYSNQVLKPYLVLRGNSSNFFNSSVLSRFDVRNNPNDFFEILQKDKYHSIHNFIDTDSFLFFTIFKGLRRHIFYCKEKSSAERIEHLIEDVFFNSNMDLMGTRFRFGAKDGNSVLFYICSDGLDLITFKLDYINDENFVSHIRGLRNEEDFNGVILWYELK